MLAFELACSYSLIKHHLGIASDSTLEVAAKKLHLTLVLPWGTSCPTGPLGSSLYMSQAHKRQKLTADPLQSVANCSTAAHHLPSLQVASLAQAGPEPSGMPDGYAVSSSCSKQLETKTRVS